MPVPYTPVKHLVSYSEGWSRPCQAVSRLFWKTTRPCVALARLMGTSSLSGLL